MKNSSCVAGAGGRNKVAWATSETSFLLVLACECSQKIVHILLPFAKKLYKLKKDTRLKYTPV